MKRKLVLNLGKKILSFFLIFLVFFQNISFVFAENIEKKDLAVVLVENSLFDKNKIKEKNSLSSKIFNYTENLRKSLNQTKTIIVPVEKETKPFVLRNYLEKLYLEGLIENNQNFQLKGVVLIGEIKKPKITTLNKIKNYSIAPYVDFEKPAYIYDEKLEEFIFNNQKFIPEIWHGVIPKTSKDIMINYFDLINSFHKGEKKLEKEIVFNDFLSENEKLNEDLLKNYFNTVKFSEEIAYQKFSNNFFKKLENNFLNEVFKEEDQELKEILKSKNENSPWGEPEKVPFSLEKIKEKLDKFSSNSPDVLAVLQKEKYLPEYFNTVKSYLNKVFEFVNNTGRYQENDLNFLAKQISQKDLEMRETLKKANTKIKDYLVSLIDDNYQVPVFLVDNSKIQCDLRGSFKQCYLYKNFFNGIPAEKIKSVEDCSWFAGSFEGEGQMIEKNATFNYENQNCSNKAGCCVLNINNPQKCNPKKAKVSVKDIKGSVLTDKNKKSPSYLNCLEENFLQVERIGSINNNSLNYYNLNYNAKDGLISSRHQTGLSSLYVHNEPREETIKKQIESIVVSNLPIDDEFYLDFQNLFLEKQKIVLPNLFKAKISLDDFVNIKQKQLENLLKLDQTKINQRINVLKKEIPKIKKWKEDYLAFLKSSSSNIRNIQRLKDYDFSQIKEINEALNLKNFLYSNAIEILEKYLEILEKKQEKVKIDNVFNSSEKKFINEALKWNNFNLNQKYFKVLSDTFKTEKKGSEIFYTRIKNNQGDLFFQIEEEKNKYLEEIKNKWLNKTNINKNSQEINSELETICGFSYEEGVDIFAWPQALICWAQNLLKTGFKGEEKIESSFVKIPQVQKPKISLNSKLKIPTELSFVKNKNISFKIYNQTEDLTKFSLILPKEISSDLEDLDKEKIGINNVLLDNKSINFKVKGNKSVYDLQIKTENKNYPIKLKLIKELDLQLVPTNIQKDKVKFIFKTNNFKGDLKLKFNTNNKQVKLLTKETVLNKKSSEISVSYPVNSEKKVLIVGSDLFDNKKFYLPFTKPKSFKFYTKKETFNLEINKNHQINLKIINENLKKFDKDKKIQVFVDPKANVYTDLISKEIVFKNGEYSLSFNTKNKNGSFLILLRDKEQKMEDKILRVNVGNQIKTNNLNLNAGLFYLLNEGDFLKNINDFLYSGVLSFALKEKISDNNYDFLLQENGVFYKSNQIKTYLDDNWNISFYNQEKAENIVKYKIKFPKILSISDTNKKADIFTEFVDNNFLKRKKETFFYEEKPVFKIYPNQIQILDLNVSLKPKIENDKLVLVIFKENTELGKLSLNNFEIEISKINKLEKKGLTYVYPSNLEKNNKFSFGEGFKNNNISLLLVSSGEIFGKSFMDGQTVFDVFYGDPSLALKKEVTVNSYDTSIGKKIIELPQKIKKVWNFNYNGDKFSDILVLTEDNFLELIENQGNFYNRNRFAKINNNILSLEILDLNQDKFEDILIATDNKKVLLIKNNQGKLSPPQEILKEKAEEIRFLSLNDFDKDGLIDILLVNSKTEIVCYYGTKNEEIFGERVLVNDDFGISLNNTDKLKKSLVLLNPNKSGDFKVKGNSYKLVKNHNLNKFYNLGNLTNPLDINSLVEVKILVPKNTVYNKIMDFYPSFLEIVKDSFKCDLENCNYEFVSNENYNFLINLPEKKLEKDLIISFYLRIKDTPKINLEVDKTKQKIILPQQNLQFRQTNNRKWQKLDFNKNIENKKNNFDQIKTEDFQDLEKVKDVLYDKWSFNQTKNTKNFNQKIEDLNDSLSNLNCQKGSCFASPYNRSFLVPGTWGVSKSLKQNSSVGSGISSSGASDPDAIPAGRSSGGMPIFGTQFVRCVIPGTPPVVYFTILPCSGPLCYDPTGNYGYCQAVSGVPDFRMYLSPSLTGGLGMAFCNGVGSSSQAPAGMCSAFAYPLSKFFGGSCEEINHSLDSLYKNADSFFSKGTKKIFNVDGLSKKTSPENVKDIPGISLRVDKFFHQQKDLSQKKATHPFFKGFFSRWFDAQSAEFSKLLDLPQITLYYPKFVNEGFQFELSEKPKKSEEKEIKIDIYNVFDELTKIPLVDLEKETIELNVPYIDEESLALNNLKLENWLEKNQKEFEKFLKSLEKKPELKNNLKFKNFVNSLKNYFEQIKSIVKSQNDLLKNYQDFPRKLMNYKKELVSYINQAILLVDKVISNYVLWGERQEKIIRNYKVFRETLKALQKNLKNLELGFKSYMDSCETCKVDTYSQNKTLFQALGGFIPEPPVIKFPKLPDLVLDLTHIEAGIKIKVPDLKIIPERQDLEFSLPNINLPNINLSDEINFDHQVDLKIPDLPQIDFPEIPDLPSLPEFPNVSIPNLPDLPPAPKLPSFLNNFNLFSWVNSIQKILKFYCIIKSGLFVYPEAELTQIMEALTARPKNPLLPIDFNILQWPNIEYPSVDELRVDGYLYAKPKIEGVESLTDSFSDKIKEFEDKTFNEVKNQLNKVSEQTMDFNKELQKLEKSLQKPVDKFDFEKEKLKNKIEDNLNEEIEDLSFIKNLNQKRNSLLSYKNKLKYLNNYQYTSKEEIIKQGETELKNSLEDLKETQNNLETPIFKGLYYYDENKQQKLFNYDFDNASFGGSFFVDIDNDQDEDVVYASLNKIFVKENLDNNKNLKVYPEKTEVFSLNKKIKSAVKNINIMFRPNKNIISWKEKENVSHYILEKKSIINGYEKETLSEYVILAKNYEGTKKEFLGPASINLNKTKFVLKDGEKAVLKNFKKPVYEWETDYNFYYLKIRALKENGEYSSYSENNLILKEKSLDKEKPILLENQTEKTPILKSKTIKVGQVLEDNSYQVLWDIDNNKEFNYQSENYVLPAQERVGKLNIPVKIVDENKNELNFKKEIDVFVPEINLESFKENQLKGFVKPEISNMPFLLLRKRNNVFNLIKPETGNRFYTNQKGEFLIEKDEVFKGYLVRDKNNNKVLYLDTKTGKITSLKPNLIIQAVPATKNYPYTHLNVLDKNKHFLVKINYVLPKTKISINKITDNLSVLIKNKNLEALKIPETAKYFASGLGVIEKENKDLAFAVSNEGQIRISNSSYSFEYKFSNNRSRFLIKNQAEIIAEIVLPTEVFNSVSTKTKEIEPLSLKNTDNFFKNLFFSKIYAEKPEFPFSDLDKNNPYFQSIIDLYERKILKGYKDGTFKPNSKISRAEFVKIALGANLCFDCGNPTEETKQEFLSKKPFPDVNLGDWFYYCISIAKREKMVTGYGDGLFHPEKNISRKEALAVLLRQAKVPLQEIPKNYFKDLPDYDWSKHYVYTGYLMGLIKNKNGFVYPDEEISRGEFAMMANLILKKYQCRQDHNYLDTHNFVVGKKDVLKEKDQDKNKVSVTKKVLEDGTELISYDNGTKTKILPDNTKINEFLSGTVQTIKPNGDEIIYFPNGLKKEIKDNKVYLEYDNGDKFVLTEDGKTYQMTEKENIKDFTGVCVGFKDNLCPNLPEEEKEKPEIIQIPENLDYQCVFVDNLTNFIAGDEIFAVIISSNEQTIFNKSNSLKISE